MVSPVLGIGPVEHEVPEVLRACRSTRSASISFTVARMLGTSVAEMSSRSVACSSAASVYSSRPDAVSITTYLNDSVSSVERPRSICSVVMSSASVGVSGAQRT